MKRSMTACVPMVLVLAACGATAPSSETPSAASRTAQDQGSNQLALVTEQSSEEGPNQARLQNSPTDTNPASSRASQASSGGEPKSIDPKVRLAAAMAKLPQHELALHHVSDAALILRPGEGGLLMPESDQLGVPLVIRDGKLREAPHLLNGLPRYYIWRIFTGASSQDGSGKDVFVLGIEAPAGRSRTSFSFAFWDGERWREPQGLAIDPSLYYMGYQSLEKADGGGFFALWASHKYGLAHQYNATLLKNGRMSLHPFQPTTGGNRVCEHRLLADRLAVNGKGAVVIGKSCLVAESGFSQEGLPLLLEHFAAPGSKGKLEELPAAVLSPEAEGWEFLALTFHQGHLIAALSERLPRANKPAPAEFRHALLVKDRDGWTRQPSPADAALIQLLSVGSRLWAVSQEGALLVLEGETWKHALVPGDSRVEKISVDEQGQLWLETNRGVYSEREIDRGAISECSVMTLKMELGDDSPESTHKEALALAQGFREKHLLSDCSAWLGQQEIRILGLRSDIEAFRDANPQLPKVETHCGRIERWQGQFESVRFEKNGTITELSMPLRAAKALNRLEP